MILKISKFLSWSFFLFFCHANASEKLLEPDILEDNKSHTLNGMGYVFFTLTPLTRSFLEKECAPGKRLLEIGTGFSSVPIDAIQKGVSEYFANDLSKDHLEILLRKAEKYLSPLSLMNLKLLEGKTPEILSSLTGLFDAILAEKVIHFFTPSEIKTFIQFVQSHLREGGKLYITMASPSTKGYIKAQEDYEERKKKGEEFPGYFTNMKARLKKSHTSGKAYEIPNSMTLFSREDLISFLENQGFKIIQSYALKIPSKEYPEWLLCRDEESQVIGVIAEKQSLSRE